jgi:hypothetical protein
MSEEKTNVEQVVEHKTEVIFKEKKLDKAKNFIKKHKKKFIAGGVAAAGTVAAIVGVKHFGLPEKKEFSSWSDDSGDHVSFTDNGQQVEVITSTPEE